MRESFVFYKSFYDSIKELDPKDQVQIYNAIFEYEFYKNESELSGVCKSIFTLIIPQLEANNKRYENGKKGGRPKTKEKPNNNQTITKVKPNVNVNDNVNVNVNDNNNVIKENIKRKKYYEDEKLNDIFLEFLTIRKKLKAVNSDRAIDMLLKTLSNYDDETKYKMIEQSIINSWKSVYELKLTKEEIKRQREKEIEEWLKEQEDE